MLETLTKALPTYEDSVFNTVSDFVAELMRGPEKPVPLTFKNNPERDGLYYLGYNSYYRQSEKNACIYRAFQRRYHRVKGDLWEQSRPQWRIALRPAGVRELTLHSLHLINFSAHGMMLKAIGGSLPQENEQVEVVITAPHWQLDPKTNRKVDPKTKERPGKKDLLLIIPARVTHIGVERTITGEEGTIHLSLKLPDLDLTPATKDLLRRWNNATRDLFPGVFHKNEIHTNGIVSSEVAFDVLTKGEYRSFFSPEKGLDPEWLKKRFMDSNDLLLKAPHLGHLCLSWGPDRMLFMSFLRAYSRSYFGHQIGARFTDELAKKFKEKADKAEQAQEEAKARGEEIELAPPRLQRRPNLTKWRTYHHGFGATQLVGGDEKERYCLGYLNASTNWMTAAHDSFVHRCRAGFKNAGEDDVFSAPTVNITRNVPRPAFRDEPDIEDLGLYTYGLVDPEDTADPLLERCFHAWEDAKDTYLPLYRQALDLVPDDHKRYHLTDLTEAFEDSGLHRSRATMVVTRQDRLVLWALLEQSSPAVNATGIFDCLRVFYPADVLQMRSDQPWSSPQDHTRAKDVLREAHSLIVDMTWKYIRTVPCPDKPKNDPGDAPQSINFLQDCIDTNHWLAGSLCTELDQDLSKDIKAGIVWIIRQSLVPDFIEHVASAIFPYGK